MKNELLMNYFAQKAYINRVPCSAVIELHTLCNFRCEHCYIPNRSSIGLEHEIVLKLLRDLRECGTVSVLFTGGEIFLREDIFDIISYARSLHMRVTLLSNAFLLNSEKVERLSKLYITDFSTTIFSLIPEINDSITNVNDSVVKIQENLELLKEKNIRVRVKMPVMKKNAMSYDQVRDYCKRNHFEFMPTFSISSKLDGDSTTRDLGVDNENLKWLVKKAEEDGIIQQKMPAAMNDPCSSLFCSISIDCKGDVYPCNSIPYKVGSIYENSIKEIWNNSEKLKFIQGITNDDLHECRTCIYKSVCTRCPGMALLEGKNIYGCDPLAKSIAEARVQRSIDIVN